MKHPLAAVGLLGGILLSLLACSSPPAVTTAASAPPAEATPSAPPVSVQEPARHTCPTDGLKVSNAEQLTSALRTATPGTVILLADGNYSGRFVATTPGTVAQPIQLCGGPAAVLDGGGVRGGYGLHLDGASHWRLIGFSVSNAQKGIVLDRVNHAHLQGLTVSTIGDEAIHLRAFSSDNVVRDCTISDTGLRRDKFGEGIYIGTAVSNWKRHTGGKPDTSDRNIIWGNRISATTAEAIDAKEGTTAGRIIGNTFDGAKLTGADSWVDVKGNDWLIESNRGVSSPGDGFQTHEILPEWGDRNVFGRNVAERIGTTDSTAVGFGLRPAKRNVVTCDNRSTGGAGLATVTCTG